MTTATRTRGRHRQAVRRYNPLAVAAVGGVATFGVMYGLGVVVGWWAPLVLLGATLVAAWVVGGRLR